MGTKFVMVGNPLADRAVHPGPGARARTRVRSLRRRLLLRALGAVYPGTQAIALLIPRLLWSGRAVFRSSALMIIIPKPHNELAERDA